MVVQGKNAYAEVHYAEALDIFRSKLGDGDVDTADTLYQMACLFRKK
jgi:hypothetical protein